VQRRGAFTAIRRDSQVTGDSAGTPAGHTPQGGVVVGNADAKRFMILFEDPQCPYCKEFEVLNGPRIAAAIRIGELAVEYRMRCFLGPESVRADNALALAAEAGRFDDLRKALFEAQPPEHTGGFTNDDLLTIAARTGLVGSDLVSGIQGARYASWVLGREQLYQSEDPQGTPAAWLDGAAIESGLLFNASRFAQRLGII
jgi:hypothetical protein